MNLEEKERITGLLKSRLIQHRTLFSEINWDSFLMKLNLNPEKWISLHKMELSGGEPALVDFNKTTGEYLIMDCAAESPPGRRSLCYDKAALDGRKENKPLHNAIDMAEEMGIEMLNETEYFYLQNFGPFDCKTSSWIKTPKEIRDLGGALFADYRYGKVFVYHNSASSYYAARGFRGMLRV